MKHLLLFPLLFLLFAPPAGAASYKDVQQLNGEIERGNITALKTLEAAGEKGDAEAQAKLGMFYLYTPSRLGFQDDVKAMEWFTRSARQGNAEAAKSLGLIYQSGYGVPRDMFKSVKWYREAAELGDSFSQELIGRNYRAGFILPKSEVHALAWFVRASEQKNYSAMRALSVMHYDGAGVQRDVIEAAKWCELALRNYPQPPPPFTLVSECVNIGAGLTKMQKYIANKRVTEWEEAHTYVASPVLAAKN